MDRLIRNGTVVTASELFKADVLIHDGKIASVGSHLGGDGAEEIDAAGLYVLPGAVDAHVHLQTPVGSLVSADDYESGTRAAACGGITTVFDFAVQKSGETLVASAKDMISVFERKACVDFSLHIAVTDVTGETLKELGELARFGVASVKMYMVYDGLMVDDGALCEALEESGRAGVLIAVHAENPAIIKRRTARLLTQGKTSAWHHYESRPEFVEAEAVKRAVHLAKAFRARLYIVHLASKEGLEEVSLARKEGYPIFAETCPQYLHFTNEVFLRKDGRNFVCSPPMKGAGSREALWEGIRRGNIDTVATDHCPFQSLEKNLGKDDFTKIPNGLMGVETMYPYMLSEANKGRITFTKAVEVCSTNPARIFGCGDKKGAIEPGMDADIVLYDPVREVTVTQGAMHSNVDYTVWEGMKLKGYPVMTMLRGRTVYADGKFLGKPGWGEFVRCSPLLPPSAEGTSL